MTDSLERVSERLTRLEDLTAAGFRDAVDRDAQLAHQIELSSQRLARLEVTVAQGFHGTTRADAEGARRDAELARRIEALDRKLDANTAAIRDDIRVFAESIRLTLVEHARRIDNIEKK